MQVSRTEQRNLKEEKRILLVPDEILRSAIPS